MQSLMHTLHMAVPRTAERQLLARPAHLPERRPDPRPDRRLGRQGGEVADGEEGPLGAGERHAHAARIGQETEGVRGGKFEL